MDDKDFRGSASRHRYLKRRAHAKADAELADATKAADLHRTDYAERAHRDRGELNFPPKDVQFREGRRVDD